MTTISVAIPCYKSAKTIPAVVEELRRTITAREGYDYEIILVNDYPDDGTFAVIESLCRNDPKVIGVNLSRNFGQTPAKMAALPFVTGDVLVYMDDDGQHPADRIFDLTDKIFEGYDIVFARFRHKHHSLFKRFTSWCNAKTLEWNGTKPKGLVLSSFYALSATAVDALRHYRSPFPAPTGYLFHVVQKYCNVDMDHRDRLAGESNYTLGKMFRMFFTGFTNFSTLPLRFAAILGVVCAMGGFLAGAVVVIRKLVNPNIAAGYTSSIALQLFIGGVIMMILGLIGEYIGRIYMTVSDMPQYRIRETCNAPTPGREDDHGK